MSPFSSTSSGGVVRMNVFDGDERMTSEVLVDLLIECRTGDVLRPREGTVRLCEGTGGSRHFGISCRLDCLDLPMSRVKMLVDDRLAGRSCRGRLSVLAGRLPSFFGEVFRLCGFGNGVA